MIELYRLAPAADERASVDVFYAADSRRDRILQVAEASVLAKGFAATSIEEFTAGNARNASQLTFGGGTSGPRANAVNIASTFELKTNVIGWLILIGCSALLVHGLRGRDRRILWLLAWPLLALGLARSFFCGQKAFLLLDFTSLKRIPSKFQ